MVSRVWLLLCLLAWSVAVPAADLSDVQLSEVFSGLTQPIFITHAGDGRNDLYIVQQNGVIRVARGNQQNGFDLLPEPFHTFSVIENTDEKGLLGLAFHPDYVNTGRLFVNLTRRVSGQLRTYVLELRRSGENYYQTDGSEKEILAFDQPQDNHNGGMMAFGPEDDMLYISTGDGGAGGDVGEGHAPEGNGQSLATPLGKILRIDINPESGPYIIPGDNPFIGMEGALPEIWALGLRNPWRFSFDRGGSHALFCGDVGQGDREEVDIIQAGGNYGWPILEGTRCNRPSQGCDNPDLIPPIAEYVNGGFQAVTGGYVYRGARIPSMQGLYIFGDYGSGEIFYLEPDGQGGWQRPELFQDTSYLIASFGEDLNGELYLCHRGGRIYRFISTDPGNTAARHAGRFH